MRTRLIVGLLCGKALACNQPAAESGDLPNAFPWDGDAPKADAFGRSLVGAPSPYPADPGLVGNPEGAALALAGDMRARREQGWKTAFKLLEPVPLLGLADQLDARPACAPGVSDADLDACGKKSEASCASATSGDVGGICQWDTQAARCLPTCDHLTLPDGSEIPRIPRFESWYGVEDVNRIFVDAYAQLVEEQQLAQAPLSDAMIGEAMLLDHTQKDRSSRWPLERYTKAVLDLFGCDLERLPEETDETFADRCAVARQSGFSGASGAGNGIARIMYSPAMVLHTMRNYAEILGCRDHGLADSWCENGEPCEDPPDNFSTCFTAEFPGDAGDPWAAIDPALVGQTTAETLTTLPEAGGSALVKAAWSRVGFGFELPAYDTDADALTRRIGPGARAEWEEDGDRRYGGEAANPDAFPTPDDIYTIQTRSGAIYRLTALHIVTKELRHWQWVTLWWSDEPDEDFGADRPVSFDDLPPVWRNYKMCTVVDYVEADPDVLGRFADFPSLQAALQATNPAVGQPTWCSNPYVEKEPGNARTNCIGCHQHAGTRIGEDGEPFELTEVILGEGLELTPQTRFPGNGRLRRRTVFPADYTWAFSRIDDLTELIRTEVEFRGTQDERWIRMNEILTGASDVTAGEEVFRQTTADQQCTNCHGEAGEGGFGPNLNQVFAQKTPWQLLHTVLEGRGSMPAWGERLEDRQLTDLFAFLRQQFDTD